MATARKTWRPGLYANIQAKHERIAQGSGEHVRAPEDAGAPSDAAFTAAEKTPRPRPRRSFRAAPLTRRSAARACRLPRREALTRRPA
jgi:hypothetical protein